MNTYNRVTLIGNLTRDPELKQTKSQTSVADLGLALNRVWTDESGERHDEVTFVDVTVWGRVAENAAKYLSKGRSVLVEGRLQMDSWQDAQTGQNRTRLRVVGETLQYLGSPAASGDRSERGERSARQEPEAESAAA